MIISFEFSIIISIYIIHVLWGWDVAGRLNIEVCHVLLTSQGPWWIYSIYVQVYVGRVLVNEVGKCAFERDQLCLFQWKASNACNAAWDLTGEVGRSRLFLYYCNLQKLPVKNALMYLIVANTAGIDRSTLSIDRSDLIGQLLSRAGKIFSVHLLKSRRVLLKNIYTDDWTRTGFRSFKT